MKTRSAFVVRNVLTGIGSKILLFILAFLNRTLFIRLLGADYTGVNGLFTNILSILALADLGIDSVLIFKLFSALKESDEDRIVFLVHKYRKIYSVIGSVILGLGIILIPFLRYIVKSELDLNTIKLYYLLHLINSAASYFFVHKTIVLVADQKKYYDNMVTSITQVLMYAFQAIYLYYTRDYIGYLVIQILCTVLKNFILTIIANRQYPYLKKKAVSTSGDFEFKDVVADTKATFMYKGGGILLNHTDNILISVILGTVYVGYYSNYYMLLQYVAAYIYVFYTGTIASVGNLNAEMDVKKSARIYRQLLFVFAVLACFCCSAFYSCVQDCIVIWIGKQYLVDKAVVVAMLCLFWGNTVFFPTSLARETLGLFKEVRLIMIPAVIINLILSFVLGYLVGMAGILLATSISKALTMWWYEAAIVCRKYEIEISEYFCAIVKYLLYTFVCVLLCDFVTSKITGDLIGLFIRIVICFVIVFLITCALFFRKEEFQEIKSRVISLGNNILAKR